MGWYHLAGVVVERRWAEQMGLQEYALLAMVILVPLVIAVVVTLWTLEQARLRSKKNRKRPTVKVEPPAPGGDAA